MSDEERAAKQQARTEKIRAEREAAKAAVREQIAALASQIPEHVRMGGCRRSTSGSPRSTRLSTALRSAACRSTVSNPSLTRFAIR
ncbi:hypothetical protein [Paraburkholderia tropica]|uniref:hypothetical protein n=1 Tax=Paraburkholderia tropica TaxID=92647 RepID=UPI00159223B3|nr:hypothetical protein [Paraburkholderia tropica]